MAIQQATYNAGRLDIGQAFEEFLVDRNTFYIGGRVLAPMPVSKKTANFPKLDREDFLQNRDLKRATGAGYNRGAFTVTDDSYECFEYGIEMKLDDSEVAFYASDFDAETAKSKVAIESLLVAQEIRVANAVFNTDTWTGASLTTTPTYGWTSATGATPIKDVQAAKEKVRTLTGMTPDTVIMNQSVFYSCIQTDEIKNRLIYVQVATEQALGAALAGLFGVRQVLIAPGIYNSVAEGQTFSGSNIWSSSYVQVACCASPGSGIMTPCIGRLFTWADDSGFPYTIETYREEQTRSNVLRARQYVDEKIIDSSYAHLLKVA